MLLQEGEEAAVELQTGKGREEGGCVQEWLESTGSASHGSLRPSAACHSSALTSGDPAPTIPQTKANNRNNYPSTPIFFYRPPPTHTPAVPSRTPRGGP